MAACIHVIGIRAHNRAVHAPKMQEVLTKHGSIIVSRNGVPSPDKETGIITLACECSEDAAASLVSDLLGIEGVNAQYMVLECVSAE